ncbi:hypothetical protein TraAM80_04074 [Trypanosoma rangeli]|uniref:BRCT domain-containing protein n=1 Tax=Trypanosoma rangeli TaxID=5698 RepID=A0A422NL43_TRYRA|nr:uncharacterized protein TraAM80_04074 [Trypanosoma rangeli]RNF06183.1 hypothetical protein TraAM80_04074 [Trypanosoma rangeli]|eukprot:RNF06183.1 hypothetical protein TraAM80_04074 [Trypanosoma rangeli]
MVLSPASSSLLTPSAAPFGGVRVFLHIRENTIGAGGSRMKHYAKKALRKLGATLTLSENTADLIVFHCGNESLLENAIAHGKIIVAPAYLQECAKCMERLSTEAFLVHPRLGHAQGTEDAAVGDNAAGRDEETEEEQCPQAELPPKRTSMGLSTIPYLDDVAEDERKHAAGGRVAGFEVQSRATTRQVAAPAVVEDDSTDEGNRTGGPFLYVGALDAPCAEEAASTVAVATSSSSTVTAKRGRRNFTDGPPAVRRKRGQCIFDSVGGEHSDGVLSKRTSKLQKRTTASATNDGTTEPTMAFTDARLITLLVTAEPGVKHDIHSGASHVRHPTTLSQLRIAVAGEDECEIQFLCDVVEQLGGIFVPRVFGRVRKPTHLVLGGRGELTPMVLLAKALGIPVLTPQWLYDAISLGEFPKIISAHLHPMYSSNVRLSSTLSGRKEEGDKEKKEEQSGGMPMQMPRKDPSIENTLIGMLQQDVGPNYRPIFLGMVFAFVSHSPLVHAYQFTELVRILGGFVSRSSLSLNLSVLVDLGYGAPLSQEEGVEGTCEEEQGDVSRAAGVRKRKLRRRVVRGAEGEGAAVETQSIPMTYQTALSDGGSVTRPTSHDVLQRLMTQRRQRDLPVIPVVSVEWIIQCILLGEATETTPFEVSLSLQEHLGAVEVDQSSETKETANSNKAVACTPPRQTRCLGNNSTREGSGGRGRVSWQTPVVTSPFAKTSEGPSSAMKRAEQQLSTQQLLLSLESDEE